MFKVLIKFFIDPFNIFWLLLLVTIGACFLKKKRLFRRLTIAVVACFLIISTPFVPNLILNSLEDRFEPANIGEITDRSAEFHILVLGGGHGFDERLPPNALLSGKALGRLTEAIRLHHQLPQSKLVLSGFSSTSGRTTQAEMLQQTTLLLGVRKKAMILQMEPGNTYEEAEVYTAKYNNDQHPVILVTSASHMQRAMMIFRTFGLDPIPSPTNYKLKGSRKHKRIGLPAVTNIENLKAGIYEYVGILWYNFRS